VVLGSHRPHSKARQQGDTCRAVFWVRTSGKASSLRRRFGIVHSISSLLALVLVVALPGCGSGARRAASVETLKADPLIVTRVTTPGVTGEEIETKAGSSSLGKNVDPSVTRRFSVKPPALDAVVEELVGIAEAEGWEIERSVSGGAALRPDGDRQTRLVIGSAPRGEGDASAWLTLIDQKS